LRERIRGRALQIASFAGEPENSRCGMDEEGAAAGGEHSGYKRKKR
jgi:hypothetical protein